MDTEIGNRKPKNKASINIEKIAKPLIRVLLSFIIWIIILILLGSISGIFALTGSPLPGLLFFVPVVIGGLLTLVVWNEEVWQKIKSEISAKIKGNISDQIFEQFKELKPEELVEIREGIAKIKEKFGLDVALPREKVKREQIDAAIRKLSDSQLLDLKQGLKNGSIEEDDLLNWLSHQEEAASI